MSGEGSVPLCGRAAAIAAYSHLESMLADGCGVGVKVSVWVSFSDMPLCSESTWVSNWCTLEASDATIDWSEASLTIRSIRDWALIRSASGRVQVVAFDVLGSGMLYSSCQSAWVVLVSPGSSVDGRVGGALSLSGWGRGFGVGVPVGVPCGCG